MSSKDVYLVVCSNLTILMLSVNQDERVISGWGLLCNHGDYCLGTLCGECSSGYSVTLDLQSCSPNDCVIGLVLFILFSCKWVWFVSERGYLVIF